MLHFVNDWELDENDFKWNEVFDFPKFDHDHDDHATAQECVKFGKWITADESQLAGWYHSQITIGPDPKPIHTGETLHSLAVMQGKLLLQFYKLYARTYDGKHDNDYRAVIHIRLGSRSLLIYLISCYHCFVGTKGHYVTRESTYG